MLGYLILRPYQFKRTKILFNWLRIQPALPPSLALAHEDDTVMQPERPFLPELEPLRPHPIARPVFRTRHLLLVGISVAEFREARFEHGAAGERARLRRGPGADLAVAR